MFTRKTKFMSSHVTPKPYMVLRGLGYRAPIHEHVIITRVTSTKYQHLLLSHTYSFFPHEAVSTPYKNPARGKCINH